MTEESQSRPSAGASPDLVSVVICSHLLARWDWLCAAVESVARQTTTAHETIVVIDGNRDLAELATHHLSTTCTVLARDECGGLSEARNTGLTAVTTPLVAFFDDDARADERWLERLMESLTDPDVMGVGGHSLPLWERGEPAWFPPELLWVVGCSYAGLPLEVAPVRNVFGGCAVYRRELFDRYGGFRADFGRHQNDAAGCEETEFCLRASSHRRDGRFIYDPQAIIHHHVPASRATVSYVAKRSFADGRSKTELAAHARGAARWQLATEITYARQNVAMAFLAGLRGGVRGDAWSVARSAVLAMSMLAAACGFASGVASMAKGSIGRLRGGPFVRTIETERGDDLATVRSSVSDRSRAESQPESTRVTHQISVVICAYTEDRWDDIVAAVESLQRQTLPPFEIVLVIDHNDSLFERAKGLSGVLVAENSRAAGASGSRNAGVAAASGSVLAFLDDDATACPEWLEMLSRSYVGQDVVGVGGCIDPEWPTEAPAWFPEEFNWVVGCTFLGMRTTTGPVRNLIGANMSVRRDVWEGVGGFREGFGNVKSAADVSWAGESRASTAEETEFCIRVSQVFPNSQWILEPRARVRHRVPSHRSTWRYFLSRSREEGLGKAVLVSAVGRDNALVEEISYASHTLPAGVARRVREAFVNRNVDGLMQSGAIVAGFSMAVAGFLERRTKVAMRFRYRPAH
jgi:glucosyl-dolichyl phosphate glucuronosyltransferase